MSSSDKAQVSVGGSTLELESRDGVLRLLWTGRSDDRHADLKLRPYFSACVQRAVAEGAALELRIDRLEYANSTTFGAIIHLIGLAHSSNIRLTIAYDGKSRWQALAIRALGWARADPRTTFLDV